MPVQRARAERADAQPEDEAALVARARTDPNAFALLYDRYVERVYQFAYRRLASHADAEDVTAQTFHRALEHLGRYEWRGLPFGAWLFRIARNLVVDHLRAAGAPLSLDEVSANGAEPADADTWLPEEALIARDEVQAAWAAVATLPPLQRRAVVLRFGRDLSHAEVGQIIGRSEAATKQLIYRAMLTLRARLGVR
jgi:RNA polymerase sigma-70 factor (ECF subfamily)